MALVLGVVKSCSKTKEPQKKDEIVSANQLLLGYKEIGDVKYDYNVLKKNIMNDDRFSGYGLRNEYCMVYQATDMESENSVRNFLGIKEELPKVDYSKHYLLLSVGRSIEDISDKNKMTTEDGEKIVDFTFAETFSKDTVYAYSMKKTKFLSGENLDIYYLENVHQYCNLEEVSRDNSQLVSDGKYHKIYKKAEDVYEYIIYSAAEQKVSSRKILNTLPVIDEFNDSMVRIVYGERDQYYNPQTDFYTTKSRYQLHYLKGTMVVFAKFSNTGELLVVVRDAYNTANYSYILRPPFSCNKDVLRNLLESVEYVDSTHIKLKFNFGDGQPIQEETVTVPNMDKSTVANNG